MRILRPRNPRVRHLLELSGKVGGAALQRNHVGMLDLPAPGHLLDHQFRIHPHLDRGGTEFGRRSETGDQSPVFGDVVGGDTEAFLPLRQNGAVCRVEHDGAVPGRPGVAPRPAVGLDDHPSDTHRPDSLVRTKIAPHSGHRTTTSGAVAVMREISPRSSSIRHAPHLRACSSAAPTLFCLRCFS